jgi:hypothetical protein
VLPWKRAASSDPEKRKKSVTIQFIDAAPMKKRKIKTQSTTRQANERNRKQSGERGRPFHSLLQAKVKTFTSNAMLLRCCIWDLMLHLIDLQDWQNEIG